MDIVRIEFNFFYTVVFIPVGLLLNLAAFCVFLRKQFIVCSNMGIYYCCILVVDSLNLLLFQLAPTLTANVLFSSDLSCRLGFYLVRLGANYSAWLRVLLVVDRLVLVNYPRRYALLRQRRKIFAGLLVLFAALCLANAPNLLFVYDRQQNATASSSSSSSSSSRSSNSGVVAAADTSAFQQLNTLDGRCQALSVVHLLATELVQALLATWLPVVLISLGSVLVMRKVASRKAQIYQNAVLDTGLYRQLLKRKDVVFLHSALTFNALFVLLNVPAALNLLLAAALRSWPHVALLCESVTHCLTQLCMCCSFFANLAFNRTFRRELTLVLCVDMSIRLEQLHKRLFASDPSATPSGIKFKKKVRFNKNITVV